MITRREIADALAARPGVLQTFAGGPVAAVAGLTVLDALGTERSWCLRVSNWSLPLHGWPTYLSR